MDFLSGARTWMLLSLETRRVGGVFLYHQSSVKKIPIVNHFRTLTQAHLQHLLASWELELWEKNRRVWGLLSPYEDVGSVWRVLWGWADGPAAPQSCCCSCSIHPSSATLVSSLLLSLLHLMQVQQLDRHQDQAPQGPGPESMLCRVS